MAAPRDAIPLVLSPRYLAIRMTKVITAALNTDGVGLTKKINRNKTIKTIIRRCFILLIINWRNQSKKLATNTKFAPLTAVK